MNLQTQKLIDTMAITKKFWNDWKSRIYETKYVYFGGKLKWLNGISREEIVDITFPEEDVVNILVRVPKLDETNFEIVYTIEERKFDRKDIDSVEFGWK